MNDDLISRKAVLKQIRKIECEPGYQHVGEDWAVGLIIAENIVESAESIESTPSAKQKPKKGQWIVHDYALGRERYECTECGGRCNFKYNFCPNCAAEMFGVAGEKYVIE